MRNLVYATPIESEDALVARIFAAAGEINDNPEVFHSARQSMSRRCNLCTQLNGVTVPKSFNSKLDRVVERNQFGIVVEKSLRGVDVLEYLKNCRGGGLYTVDIVPVEVREDAQPVSNVDFVCDW
ncbi:hypothetical protein ANN_09899 [Periplaneta americana]|uniref:Uncharacterized protein n=1 Tax=Periplaneta americana TaxID=6978 RepID=A0ABQ8TQ81_PERAM|nr:hypothetical protein ANN_09899 [Periplaneta americana]